MENNEEVTEINNLKSAKAFETGNVFPNLIIWAFQLKKYGLDSKHIHYVDTQLNTTIRIITGTINSNPLPWLPSFV